MVLNDLIIIIPPHQSTTNQLLRRRFFLLQPLLRLRVYGHLARNFPLPSRKVLVSVDREGFDLEVVEVVKGTMEVFFNFFMLHAFSARA